MCFSEASFESGSIVECEPRSVMLDDQSMVNASKRGELVLPFENATIRLKNVLLIPGLGYNLVSVGSIADNGIRSLFRSEEVELLHECSGLVIGHGFRDDETMLDSLPNPVESPILSLAKVSSHDTTLWHQRLAHMNGKDLLEVYKHVDGVPRLEKWMIFSSHVA